MVFTHGEAGNKVGPGIRLGCENKVGRGNKVGPANKAVPHTYTYIKKIYVYIYIHIAYCLLPSIAQYLLLPDDPQGPPLLVAHVWVEAVCQSLLCSFAKGPNSNSVGNPNEGTISRAVELSYLIPLGYHNQH